MRNENDPSDTTRIVDGHTIYVHIYTYIACLSKILVVSEVSFSLCINYPCCIGRIVSVTHKQFLLDLMECVPLISEVSRPI